MTRGALVGCLLASFFAHGPSARAAEVTRVVSGNRAPGELFDFNLSMAWVHEQRTASVRREYQGQQGGGETRLLDDLTYRQTRDILVLRADAGIFRDLGAFVSAPLVIADDRSLSFAGGVTDVTSTILRDGILPGFGMAQYGWDTAHDRPFERPSTMLFRGPARHGLEYLGVGINWAAFNQARDDTKPTWIVRFESRLSVAGDMRFDPAQPQASKGVGLGYHQHILSTMFSRHFGRLDPYLGGWYMLPQLTSGSPFGAYPLGTGGYGHPQHRAGVQVGIEGVVWEKPAARQRVTLELRGRMELRFFGLAQSELWEAMSGPSTCRTKPGACRKDVDTDLNGDGLLDANPGITRSPTYGLFGGDAGLNVQVGRFVRFRTLFGMTIEENRYLTDGRSGNALYDGPGRRFRIENARSWSLIVDGALLF